MKNIHGKMLRRKRIEIGRSKRIVDIITVMSIVRPFQNTLINQGKREGVGRCPKFL
ncbi:MAG: hypothetical protein SPJ81_05775 [Lachnoclostridium sp.]|nr:hypothetical protein [Lachnoclostridium sp.]